MVNGYAFSYVTPDGEMNATAKTKEALLGLIPADVRGLPVAALPVQVDPLDEAASNVYKEYVSRFGHSRGPSGSGISRASREIKIEVIKCYLREMTIEDVTGHLADCFGYNASTSAIGRFYKNLGEINADAIAGL